ncbi:M28 family peptidase [Sphingomonas nostoxanthinifaciens]|uniref:M28 family peptidase n=1 Tax=Sphingomonas nostoxanthinifaciens TaxID=2872652 RepID=UPI001CC2059A|nr:M28 family peptidase [Sphingomonas nostoxanthinifaciens]UAK25037.1 M28 family peptidase [Sphingomonas nostoxanthinifaciens]
MFALPLLAAAAASLISPDRIKADDKVLSSDAFAGRGPGEVGERQTTAFLTRQFAAAGLKPGGANGGWLQDVPMVRLDRAPGATMAIAFGGTTHPLALGTQATLGLHNAGRTTLTDAPLVFAGFGVVDAKRGWDAYRGIDMSGKVAVVLANDPDFEGGRDLGFEGRRLVYAGRIGAKFEAAAKAGAIAVLVIHEDAAASYPFFQVGSGDAVPSAVLAPLLPTGLKATGWLAGDVAAALLQQQGLTLDALKQRARDPAFHAFPLPGASLSLDGTLIATPFISHNVIARLPGASRPDGYVIYGAHWDANGTNGPDATGDAIRNGAIDNGAGTAELLEVARAFAHGPRPARTVVFAAWTAEEKGLLGSEYYAAHPLYPLERTALALNLDPHLVLPAARDLELIGGGRTPLEAELTRVAAANKLRVVPEPFPEAGWYFRSDHYSFAKRGVPTVAFRAGRDLIDGGHAKGDAIVARYNHDCYHQPCDQFDPRWTFAGTAQEATVAYQLGREVADSATWPDWNADSEYQPLRATSAAARSR